MTQRPGQPGPRRRGRTARGFTLVEVVLTVVIVALLGTIAAPRYAQSLARYRVDAAARRVVADLEFAQQRAQARSKAVSAGFFPTTDKLVLAGIDNLDHAGQAYATELAAEPYRADLVSADFGGSPTLTYTGFGRPSAGGTIVLTAGGNTRTITVDPATGEATLP